MTRSTRRAIAAFVTACAVLTTTLTGCQMLTVDDSCTALISAASKSALTVTDLLSNGEIGFSKLEAAAEEVEGYMEPLRELDLSGKIAPLRDSLVTDMDKLLVAVRAYDTERITLVAQNMAKTAVDIDLACR